MTVRIVVADSREARFYDIERADMPLRRVGHLPEGKTHHQHERESVSHQHEADPFVRQVAHALETARQQNTFERLVLIAGPQVLGLLRGALSKSLTAEIVAEVPKDLVHQSDADVLAHVPESAFAHQQK